MSALDAALAERDYRADHLRRLLRRIATAATEAANDMATETDNPRGRTAKLRRANTALTESLILAEATQRRVDDLLTEAVNRRATARRVRQ